MDKYLLSADRITLYATGHYLFAYILRPANK